MSSPFNNCSGSYGSLLLKRWKVRWGPRESEDAHSRDCAKPPPDWMSALPRPFRRHPSTLGAAEPRSLWPQPRPGSVFTSSAALRPALPERVPACSERGGGRHFPSLSLRFCLAGTVGSRDLWANSFSARCARTRLRPPSSVPAPRLSPARPGGPRFHNSMHILFSLQRRRDTFLSASKVSLRGSPRPPAGQMLGSVCVCVCLTQKTLWPTLQLCLRFCCVSANKVQAHDLLKVVLFKRTLAVPCTRSPPPLPHLLPLPHTSVLQLLDRKLQSAVIVLPPGYKPVGLSYTVILQSH